ncbi:hypothetical protein QYM36_012508 [Artemia franciscana]|uniref:Uncharacterized protein n=1 Tax=Artemia franciscana TaxID=6661 RepID=A0AA88HSZ0_ARTSF|nr:hypothetical protein QYM36_012508 [Artemia franciscana]
MVAKVFALQLDESMNVPGKVPIIVFVRYQDHSDIRENILICQNLESRKTGEELFKVINQFFSEKGILWDRCPSVCCDGAATLTGKNKGIEAWIRKKNMNVKLLHCIIHRQALASKRMNAYLHETLNVTIVKVIDTFDFC